MNAVLSPESRASSALSCASLSAALPPPSSAALTSVVSMPRMGVEFKDRIFVGGFPPGTTDTELRNFFAKFGNVKEAKIIRDHTGTSKGYGFITYESEEEARKVRDSCGNYTEGESHEELDFKGRKLNVGPAIKKASNRAQNLDIIPQGAVILAANGTPFVVQNGLTLCASPDAYTVAHPAMNNSYPFFLSPQQFIIAAPHQYVMPQNVSQMQQTSSPNITIQQEMCPNQYMTQTQSYASHHHLALSPPPSMTGPPTPQPTFAQPPMIGASGATAFKSLDVATASGGRYHHEYMRGYNCQYDLEMAANAGGGQSVSSYGSGMHAQHAGHQSVLTPPPTPLGLAYKN